MWAASLLSAGLVMFTPQAQSDILIDHDFDTGADGWGDRDVGEMDVNWNGSEMQGDFAQDIFTPETDAFRLDSGLGDLTQGGTYILTSWVFQFFADTISPSDLIFRFGNMSFTFFRAATVGLNTLSLASVSGWFGGNQAQFDSVLASTTFVEVQVTRNGFDAQTYRLNNFQLNGDVDDGGGNGGGPSAVPEPNTINLLLFVALLGMALRRYRGFDRTVAADPDASR